jgi:hypothetical protein
MSEQQGGPSYRMYDLGAGPSRPGASRVDSRAVAFIAALLILIGLCGILYVGQASRVFVLRRLLADRSRERVRYYRENAILLTKIARAGASENLGAWAAELGYVVVGKPHHVTFSYAPVPDEDGGEAYQKPEALFPSQEGEEEGDGGWAARLARWGEDLLNQFREWIDLAAVREKESP